MVLVVLLVIVEVGTAQVWQQGVVVLTNDEVLTGKVAHVQPDLLLVEQEGNVTVYAPHKVVSFRYHDSLKNINRHFLSLKPEANSPLRYLFEVVVFGKMKVVRRNGSFTDNALKDDRDFQYYTWFEGTLSPLRKFKSKVFDHLSPDEHGLLSHFASEQRLNPAQMADAIQIILHYNKASQARTSIAGL